MQGVAALRSVSRMLRQLSKVPAKASRDAAKEIKARIRQEFATGTDPYGNAWAPLRPATLAKGRQPPPLTDTGEMASVTVEPAAKAGIVISLGADYSRFHQTGTRNMAARPILPDHRGLPDTWRRSIEDAIDRAWRRAQ